MKCAEIEKLVYLYDIASDKEQKLVLLHFTTCDSCRALWQLQQENQRLMKEIGSISPVLDEALLVNRVMASLPHPAMKKTNVFSFENSIYFTWLRYSFAMVSAILVGGFFLEYNMDPGVRTQQDHSVQAKMITLNSNQFFSKRKESPVTYSLVACISSCKEETPVFCKECPSFIVNQ